MSYEILFNFIKPLIIKEHARKRGAISAEDLPMAILPTMAVFKTTFTSSEALEMIAWLKEYIKVSFILHKAEFKVLTRKTVILLIHK
jgi:hypothetical protein